MATKRKRNEYEEVEVDLNAPEPVSKKEKRKERKSKPSATSDSSKNPPTDLALDATSLAKDFFNSDAGQNTQKHSKYGIWIGNLPFTANKDTVRKFLQGEGEIDGKVITRLHLPTTKIVSREDGKVQNKGFAYVDFTSQEVLDKALKLSEKMLDYRRVLIKDAKSFEGRPEKSDDQKNADAKPKVEPTKKVFVGNLAFDVSKEELVEHFSPAGQVEDIFLATFEDTGKCKGYAWLRFADISAAEAAVKGFVKKKAEASDTDSEASGDDEVTAETKKRKKSKLKVVFINRLRGRQLRCEFAEDAQTRYKKRFGKDAKRPRYSTEQGTSTAGVEVATTNGDNHVASNPRPKEDAIVGPDKGKVAAEERREQRRKRHESRTAAATKTLTDTPKANGAIVAATGTKMRFED